MVALDREGEDQARERADLRPTVPVEDRRGELVGDCEASQLPTMSIHQVVEHCLVDRRADGCDLPARAQPARRPSRLPIPAAGRPFWQVTSGLPYGLSRATVPVCAGSDIVTQTACLSSHRNQTR